MVTCTGGKEPLGSAKCKLFVLALHNQPSSLESSSLSSPSSSLFLSRWRHRMITTLMVTKLFPQSRDWGEWMMTLWCRTTPPCGGSDQRLRKTSRIWHYCFFLFFYYYFDMAIYDTTTTSIWQDMELLLPLLLQLLVLGRYGRLEHTSEPKR